MVNLARPNFRLNSARWYGLPIGSLLSQHFANFYLGWFDRFVKEQLRVKGYVRYMDDMLLWGATTKALLVMLDRCQDFLAQSLHLTLKPYPYINRTAHGVDFLGCRLLPDHLILNRRSRLRFRHRMIWLEEEYLANEIDEFQLQQRATSLIAFTKSAGAKSWHWRQAVLQVLLVSGRGHAPGDPRRQLAERRQELPVGEPQLERAGEPQQ